MLNPDLIDPIAFAKNERTLSGTFNLVGLDERVSGHEFLAGCDAEGHYQLLGGRDKWKRFFLILSVELDLSLVCQRCLAAMPYQMAVQNRIYLFANEERLDEAMAQDEDLEGIVAEEYISVNALIEDEILMALPFSPRHERCENPELDKINQDKPNPFSVLTDLKS